MGRLLETESPASFASAAVATLVEHIQKHLRKDRTLSLSTHRKMIRRDFPNVRADMVRPTEINVEALHRMARRGAIAGVVYIEKESHLDKNLKTDLIVIRPDNTAVAIQVAGSAGNAQRHRKMLRDLFETEDLSRLPIVVTKSRTTSGREHTIQEFCEIYESAITNAPGIPLTTRQRRVQWK